MNFNKFCFTKIKREYSMYFEKENSLNIKIITFVIIWVFITIPFSAFKGYFFNPDEGNIIILSLNRIILLCSGLYCFFTIINLKIFKMEFYSFTTLTLLTVYISSLGILYTIIFSGNLINLADIVFLIMLLIITNFIIDYNILKLLLLSSTLVLLFHSLDIIFQTIFTFNIAGIEPVYIGKGFLSNRNWGFFNYGSPTAGYFFSMLFFIPLFCLQGIKRILFYILLITAIILTNDRGPIIQLSFAILYYFIVIKRYYFQSFIGISLFATGIYYLNNMKILPTRIGNVIDVIQFYTINGWSNLIINYDQKDSDLVKVALHHQNLYGYMEKISILINQWYTYDNLIYNLFGIGLGSSDLVMGSLTDLGRPHNLIIEILAVTGLIPGLILVLLILKFMKKNKDYVLIFLPTISPLTTHSITSFNFMFLIFFQILLVFQLSKYKNQNK